MGTILGVILGIGVFALAMYLIVFMKAGLSKATGVTLVDRKGNPTIRTDTFDEMKRSHKKMYKKVVGDSVGLAKMEKEDSEKQKAYKDSLDAKYAWAKSVDDDIKRKNEEHFRIMQSLRTEGQIKADEDRFQKVRERYLKANGISKEEGERLAREGKAEREKRDRDAEL